MKKWILLIFALALGSGFAKEPNHRLKVNCAETYVDLHPLDTYLHVKEYRLGTISQKKNSVKKIKTLITKAEYCKKRFGFEGFTAIEERMGHDRDFITGEYHLLTREENIIKMLEDAFGGTFGRKVSVSINPKEIELRFEGKDIQIRSNNAKGVYGKENQQMIVWKNGVQHFEVVFGMTEEQSFPSFAKSFGENVASPEWSAEEINAWKNKPVSAMEKLDEGYQHDADIFRLRHLEYLGRLIAEYHEKTGQYPLQGESDCLNYVFIATPRQQKSIQGEPPQKHITTDLSTFRAALEKGLGRAVDLKFDPQKVSTHAPNFYIYMIDGETYYLAIHLYHKFPFANPVDKHYNKVEITNGDSSSLGQWSLEKLLANPAFKNARETPPHKEPFFKHLEEENK
jgi:hypothetical protein